jgi:hypothetical protein
MPQGGQNAQTPAQGEDRQTSGKVGKAARLEEKTLQALCESWLRQRGYHPMRASEHEHVGADGLPVGWYAHMDHARENPDCRLPDLLITDGGMRRCLAVELKVRRQYEPGQREMIGAGAWVEAWGLDGLIVAVEGWEEGKE